MVGPPHAEGGWRQSYCWSEHSFLALLLYCWNTAVCYCCTVVADAWPLVQLLTPTHSTADGLTYWRDTTFDVATKWQKPGHSRWSHKQLHVSNGAFRTSCNRTSRRHFVVQKQLRHRQDTSQASAPKQTFTSCEQSSIANEGGSILRKSRGSRHGIARREARTRSYTSVTTPHHAHATAPVRGNEQS